MEREITDISEVHFDIFKEFKRNVAGILTPNDTDTYLLKWLKSKNYNIRKAEASFRETHAFREFYSLDSMLKWYKKPDIREKYEYTAFLGYAKDGSVIRYSALGKGDHYGVISSLSGYQLGFYGINVMEEDCEHQRIRKRLTGEEITEITYVFDLEGMAFQDILHRCVYESGFDLIHLAQELYPEIWGRVLFVNAPSYFDALFSLFKPVFRMSLIQKMQVVSRDSTPEALLKYIDEDILPDFLGGKRTDFMLPGGKIPEKYYRCNLPYLNPSDPEVTDIWVRPRSVYNHKVTIRKPNTTIRVEARTERGSIQLSIYYRSFPSSESDVSLLDEHTDEREEHSQVMKISPAMRLQTHISPLDEKNIAQKPGIYIYRFANCSSWFTSRRLIFRIRTIEDL